jgi:hypothetical protein
MKLLYAVAWVALTALVSADTGKLVPLEVAQETAGGRYRFVYAGDELGTGQIVLYRFDVKTGEMFRIVFTRIPGDAEAGRPLVHIVEQQNLLNLVDTRGALASDRPAWEAWHAAQSSAP